jgi:ubiquinone/menaquinone biosynthesis C-methylase UbiE
MNELWTQKIFTLQGLTGENILEGKKALDVGCGHRKLPGALGIDVIKDSKVDVVHDLSVFPWPLKDNSFDLVLMNSVLEHVIDVLKTLGEVHRVGKPGAHVLIKVPYFRSTDAFADPSHYHFFTSRSMDFFVEGTEFRHYGYVPFHFKKLGFWYGWPHPSKNPLKQLMKLFAHRFPDFYDQYLSLLLPVECVFWELEVIK